MHPNTPDPGSGRPEDRMRRLLAVSVEAPRIRRPPFLPVVQVVLLVLGVALICHLLP